jgi:S-adenosylmethionine synthetase
MTPPTAMRHVFTSESVTEGHPDKVADLISDSILDACMAEDERSRVACEALVKGGDVVVAGEITTTARIEHDAVVRGVIRRAGYTDPDEPFNADGVRIHTFMTKQAREIAAGVARPQDDPDELGAGDQGIMFGYATDETPQLMPLPIHLAHRLAERLAEDRRSGRIEWLRPDGKTQVSVEYEGAIPRRVNSVLVSAQHRRSVDRREVLEYVREELMPAALGSWHDPSIEVLVNPAGTFVEGGPSIDAGLTGRKIIADTYGGTAHHGGGSFSGKDPSKVDRSGAYYCRFAARRIVLEGLARRAEIQVAYAIGRARPLSVYVDTFGTGDPRAATDFVQRTFDFRPASMIRALRLLRPIYASTTNYGHFGRPGLPWEEPSGEPVARA